MRRLLALAVMLVVAGDGVLSIAHASAQEPVPNQQVFRAETTIVPIDVRVLDKKGQPVTGLTQEDFTLREDGVLQEIRNFSTQAYVADPSAASMPLAVDDRWSQDDGAPAKNRRVFLILMEGNLQEPANGYDGLLHFVRDLLLPQDMVAIASSNRATEFTTDHERVAQVIARSKAAASSIGLKTRFGSAGPDAIVSGDDALSRDVQGDIDRVFTASRTLTARTLAPVGIPSPYRGSPSNTGNLGRLYTGIQYLSHIAGEKHLLFTSQSGLDLPRYEDDVALARTAADARVVLDIIVTGGVGSLGPWSWETSHLLAKATGGRFYANRFKTVSGDVEYIERAASFAYVLGYQPTNLNWNGKYRKIKVAVNRPGLTVVVRDGYYARPAEMPADRRRTLTYVRLIDALNAPFALPDIPIRLAATLPTAPAASGSVSVTMTIDPSHMAVTHADGRTAARVSIAVFCLDKRGVVLGRLSQELQLTFADSRWREMVRDGWRYDVAVPVKAGVKSVRAAVYNYDADVVGSGRLIVK